MRWGKGWVAGTVQRVGVCPWRSRGVLMAILKADISRTSNSFTLQVTHVMCVPLTYRNFNIIYAKSQTKTRVSCMLTVKDKWLKSLNVSLKKRFWWNIKKDFVQWHTGMMFQKTLFLGQKSLFFEGFGVKNRGFRTFQTYRKFGICSITNIPKITKKCHLNWTLEIVRRKQCNFNRFYSGI